MKSHELLRDVIGHANPKEIASRLGVSLSLVYKWAEPSGQGGSGAANPLDRLDILMQTAQDARIAQWVAERAGGFFVKNPVATDARSRSVVVETNHVVQEFAEMLAVIATAAIDNSVSPTEAMAIRARWENLKSVTEGFVQCCEQGNFARMVTP